MEALNAKTVAPACALVHDSRFRSIPVLAPNRERVCSFNQIVQGFILPSWHINYCLAHKQEHEQAAAPRSGRCVLLAFQRCQFRNQFPISYSAIACGVPSFRYSTEGWNSAN